MAENLRALWQEWAAVYGQRTPTSRRLWEEAQQYLPGGDSRYSTFHKPYPLYLDRGQGAEVWDVDGNRYLDFVNNYSSLVHGHAQEDVTRAALRQAEKGFAFGGKTTAEVNLARVLCERVPGVERVRFCNSGTEAVMVAARGARAYTGRRRLAKVIGAYHGSWEPVQIAAPMPTTAEQAEREGVPRMIADDTVLLPWNDLPGTEAAIRAAASDLAAVIIEPFPAQFGYVPPQPGYLQGVQELCHELGVLVIDDEVQTLRMAQGGAQTLLGLRPDIIAFGKLIGGGLPIGAVGGRADVMAVFDPTRQGGPLVAHAGTFNANPLAMETGLAAVQLLTPEAIGRINDLGERLRTGLLQVLVRRGVAGQVTGAASFLQVHFTPDPVVDWPSAATARKEPLELLHLGLVNEGILAIKRASLNLSTPMQSQDVEACLRAFDRVIGQIQPLIGFAA